MAPTVDHNGHDFVSAVRFYFSDGRSALFISLGNYDSIVLYHHQSNAK